MIPSDTFGRRECLKGMAGLAAGTWAGGPPLAAARRKLAVGAHIWVYAAKQPRNDPSPILDQIFQELGAAGLDGVELMHAVLAHDGAVARVRELSERYRLPVIGCSWSAATWDRGKHNSILEEGTTLIRRIAQVKGRTLGMSVGNAGHKKTPAELDAQAEMLKQLIRLCAVEGVVLNLHNHTYEVADQEHDLSGTLARVPEAKLGPDIGWLVRAKIDPVDFIRRHGKRIVFCHLRDQTAGGKWSESVGEGSIDFAAIGRALREAGFAGDLVIELAHERDFVPTRPYGESFRRSREHIRKVMGY